MLGWQHTASAPWQPARGQPPPVGGIVWRRDIERRSARSLGCLWRDARGHAVPDVRDHARAADGAAAALPESNGAHVAGRAARHAGRVLRRLLRHAYQPHRALSRVCSRSAACCPKTSIRSLTCKRAAARSATPARDDGDGLPLAPPPAVIRKSTSGTTGEPVVVRYNAESRHWRDATRWRGYGWAATTSACARSTIGARAAVRQRWLHRTKLQLDRFAQARPLSSTASPRGEQALTRRGREAAPVLAARDGRVRGRRRRRSRTTSTITGCAIGGRSR